MNGTAVDPFEGSSKRANCAPGWLAKLPCTWVRRRIGQREIPGRDAPPADGADGSVLGTYEPGVIVIAQGRKRVDLGRTTFIYGESRYLLTSVDLPIVSQIIEASEETPCLALSLKLEMSVVRELLNREEIQMAEAPSDSPAMATGEDHGGISRRVLPAHRPAGHTYRTFPFSAA